MASNASCELENVSSSSDLNLLDLPKELFFEIFEFLPKKDLLNLTQVCKFFNDIISNKFINKLSVWFSNAKHYIDEDDEEIVDRKWIGSRRYTNVHFDVLDFDDLFYFATLMRNPERVKTLTFQETREYVYREGNERIVKIQLCEDVTSKVFLSLLRYFENVQTLSLPNLNHSEYLTLRNKPTMAIKKLHVSHQFEFPPAVFGTSIREISIRRNLNFHNEKLEELILAQEALTSMTLDLREIDVEEFLELPLFISNALDKVKFRLKTLILFNPDELTENQNFRNFIKNHAESLRTLKIFEFSDVSILNNFESVQLLKNVVLGFKPEIIGADSLHVQSNIESLEISLHNFKLIENLDKKFPNLKRLKLSKVDGDIEVGGCNKLEHLSIEKSSSEILNIPSSVKHLEIIEHTFEAPPEFIKPIGVKSLILKKCENVEWLQKLIEDENFELGFLEMEAVKFPFEFIQIFLNNKHKIKVVRKNIKFNRNQL